MKLEIFDETELLDKDFGMWLIVRLRDLFYSELDTSKLSYWNTYFNDSEEYQSMSGNPIHTSDILVSGIKNLTCRCVKNKLTINIRPNQFVPNLDRVPVDITCKLINYGNTSVKGYPIFTNIFKEVSENIKKYIDMYVDGII